MVSKPLDVLRKGLEHLQNHVKAQAVMDLDAHNTTDCNDADDPGPIKSSPTHTKALQVHSNQIPARIGEIGVSSGRLRRL